jgi:hypothetical protein
MERLMIFPRRKKPLSFHRDPSRNAVTGILLCITSLGSHTHLEIFCGTNSSDDFYEAPWLTSDTALQIQRRLFTDITRLRRLDYGRWNDVHTP